jgi:hypothetical protein
MSSAGVLEGSAPPQAASGAKALASPPVQVGEERLVRLLEVAGDVGGDSVLVVGSVRLGQMAREAGATPVAIVEAHPVPEGFTAHAGPFSATCFVERYERVLVPVAFDAEGDPFPVVARACAVATREVVAFLPRPRRSFLGLGSAPAGPSHDFARVRGLFVLAGAMQVEERTAPGGFIVRASLVA